MKGVLFSRAFWRYVKDKYVLTDKELLVAIWLCSKGNNYKTIGTKLGNTPLTIKAFFQKIRVKMQNQEIHTRVDMVLQFVDDLIEFWGNKSENHTSG